MSVHVESSDFERKGNGVLKNGQGRIISLGWPNPVPLEQQAALRMIETTIRELKTQEKSLFAQNSFPGLPVPAVLVDHERFITYNLASLLCLPYMIPILTQRLEQVNTSEQVNLVDIGGGSGALLAQLVEAVRNTPMCEKLQQLRLTLTALTDTTFDQVQATLAFAQVRTLEMALELPEPSLVGTFDVAIVQNSFPYWSAFPELCYEHLALLLKPLGCAIISFPLYPRTVSGGRFSHEEFLRANSLFAYEQLSRHPAGGVVAKLTKKT